MSGPITFDPIRSPALPDPCDGVAAFKGIADDAGANFDKVETFFNPAHPPWTVVVNQYRGTSQPISGGTGGTFIPWPSFLPMFVMTVPTPCVAIWVTLEMQLSANEHSDNAVGVAVHFEGLGYRGPNPQDNYAQGITARNCALRGTRNILLLGSELVPGQELHIPLYLTVQASSGVSCHIGPGAVTAVAFTGAP